MYLDPGIAFIRDRLRGIAEAARGYDWVVGLAGSRAAEPPPPYVDAALGRVHNLAENGSLALPLVPRSSEAKVPDGRKVYKNISLSGQIIANHFVECQVGHLCSSIEESADGAIKSASRILKPQLAPLAV